MKKSKIPNPNEVWLRHNVGILDFRFWILFLFGFGILILGFTALVGGCAKTVTPIVNYGTILSVEVNLRGTSDFVNNRYFMILSSDRNFKVPLPPPDSLDEFLSVGDLPQQGSAESYYNYYSTWSGYIEINNLGCQLIKGPFAYGNSITAEAIKNIETLTSKLSFDFRLDQIFGSLIPNTIYFDIVSVKYPLNSYKEIQDLLYPPVRSIQKFSGSEVSGSDDANLNISSSLDILSWKVIIQ